MPKDITILGNWKMHGSTQSIDDFIAQIPPNFITVQKKQRIGIALPATLLAAGVKKFTQITWLCGAQDVSEHALGAYTGCVSAAMLAEHNCHFCLVGHSERRTYQQETDQQIADKIIQLNKAAIAPVLCIGETLAQRQAHQAQSTIHRQLGACLSALKDSHQAFVAYEPIWAIGTGNSASIAQATQSHQWIRDILDKNNQKNVKILYGGSVNADNVASLVNAKHIDGVLVGGASLTSSSFSSLIAQALSS